MSGVLRPLALIPPRLPRSISTCASCSLSRCLSRAVGSPFLSLALPGAVTHFGKRRYQCWVGTDARSDESQPKHGVPLLSGFDETLASLPWRSLGLFPFVGCRLAVFLSLCIVWCILGCWSSSASATSSSTSSLGPRILPPVTAIGNHPLPHKQSLRPCNNP